MMSEDEMTPSRYTDGPYKRAIMGILALLAIITGLLILALLWPVNVIDADRAWLERPKQGFVPGAVIRWGVDYSYVPTVPLRHNIQLVITSKERIVAYSVSSHEGIIRTEAQKDDGHFTERGEFIMPAGIICPGDKFFVRHSWATYFYVRPVSESISTAEQTVDQFNPGELCK